MRLGQHFRIIAHRGASGRFEENSWQAILFAAANEVDGIELDLRRSLDGQFILFHDRTLARIDGTRTRPEELTVSDLNQRLVEAGRSSALLLGDLLSNYRKAVPLLFDLKLEGFPTALVDLLGGASCDFYLGVRTPDHLKVAATIRTSERILAFVPHSEAIREFTELGAGIVRLWEKWTDSVLISECHQRGLSVWIMVGEPGNPGQADEAVLERIHAAGADGVLLNDIELALHWRKRHYPRRGEEP